MKKIVSMFLCVCMAIGLGCMAAGCGNDELLKRIDALQTQNTQLAEKLGEIQSKLDEQNEIIEELKSKTTKGVFYTVSEAYEKNYITLEDVKSIAYYNNSCYYNDGRKFNEQIMPEDYKPKPKTPEVLTENMQRPIKQTAWEEGNRYQESPDYFKIKYYFGTYSGCIAIYFDRWWYDTGAAERFEYVGGVTIYYPVYQVYLWKQIN